MEKILEHTTEEFLQFQKIARFSRDIIITEKIDGTNAQVYITEYGDVIAGSRKRYITPSDDNHGFAVWVEGNKNELLKLGPGRNYGEWWGGPINRGYGLPKGEKYFSMFNTIRWCAYGETPARIHKEDPRIEKYQEILPECCRLVPVLYHGAFLTDKIEEALTDLQQKGSYAAPGFMNPEGIVIFHPAANICFKKTIKNDEIPKSFVT
ncbi:MAG TPA: RNA ligase family protein [Chitinophagaceae bacterium]|nr:RNA ligase family protein [Chitinophagaceae bacterium]